MFRTDIALFVILLCLIGLVPSIAFAEDNCKNLESNKEWTRQHEELVELIQAMDYDKAQALAKRMSKICDQTPALHYMQGKIAEELGNKSDALLHYQKASEYTYQFAVAPDMAKKIWYARYENEHPERTAQSLKESAEQNETRLKENTSSLLAQFREEQKLRNYKLMWTGIGLGIGGAALLGTGLGLWSGYYNEPLDTNHKHVVVGYKMSLALMGTGTAFTLTGIILAGLFGHWYKQSDVSYSFDIVPNGAMFRMDF
ncbi:MAG: hypothetical protein IJU23_12615 [Proteobacteria bacterium]|nr:hypothetical protein [Pseudomonadota bacterium]